MIVMIQDTLALLTKKTLKGLLPLFFSILMGYTSALAQVGTCASGHCPTAGVTNLPASSQQIQIPLPSAQKQEDKKPFLSDRKRGWWWYEKKSVEPEQKEKKETSISVKVNLDDYTHQELWDMYPDNFQKILKIVLKQAVQNPTVKNVKDYLTMQDISKRKSMVFANVVGYVGQINPDFSINEAYPVTAPGRRALTAMTLEEKNDTIRKARDQYGLIMFSREECRFCRSQSEILAYFEDYFGWPVRNIDIGFQPDTATRFNVEKVPQIIIVSKETGDYMPISVGTTSMAELKDRIYRAIRMMEGKIGPEQWYIHDFEKGTSIDPLQAVPRHQNTIADRGQK